MAICPCPPSAELPDISKQECEEKYGNINKFVIGRLAGGDFTDITDETEFDTRLAAADNTKIVLTPLLSSGEIPMSELLSTATNNKDSPFGQGFRNGEGAVDAVFMAKNTESNIKDELKQLECYSDLVVALIDSYGAIGAKGTTTLFPITKFFISTKSFGGLDDTDNFQLSFTFRPNWDEGLQRNALTWDIFSK